MEEFANLAADEDELAQVSDPKMEREYRETRRHEFRTAIDTNGDEKATIEELLTFVEPSNHRHAQTEADEIISLADTNGDGYVNEKELLSKIDLLMSSGFIHPKARLHDDL